MTEHRPGDIAMVTAGGHTAPAVYGRIPDADIAFWSLLDGGLFLTSDKGLEIGPVLGNVADLAAAEAAKIHVGDTVKATQDLINSVQHHAFKDEGWWNGHPMVVTRIRKRTNGTDEYTCRWGETSYYLSENGIVKISPERNHP